MTPGKIITLAFVTLIALSASTDARSNYNDFNFSTHEITAFASAGVTPDYIRQIKNLGYKNISAHDIIAFYSVGVSPKYIQQIKNLGYRDISTHDIVAFYSVGVRPEYIQQIKNLGYKNFSTHNIVALYSVGVTPDYIKQLKKSGQKDLSTQDIITLYSSGASPNYIKQLKKLNKHTVHIPEIHIPEIQVQVPNVQVQVKTNPVIASQYQYEYDNEVSDKWFWKSFAKYAVIALILACTLVPLAFVFRHKLASQVATTNPLDTRITNFEQRVNDLQDILLSIDDRLDRKIRQS